MSTTEQRDASASSSSRRPSSTDARVGSPRVPLALTAATPSRINVFLVWEWNPDDGNADAEVNFIGNKFIIFEDDLVAVSTPGRVLGHEIGHLFTLEHDKVTTDALMFVGPGLIHGRLRKDEILKARKGI